MTKCAELANLIGNINAGGGGVNRNFLINSAMTVAQRGVSFSQTTSSNYTLDRWQAIIGSSFNLDTTITQSTTVPSGQGFKNSLKVEADSAVTPSGSDNGGIAQKLEQHDVERLMYGTSDAKSVTLSFWVRSNKTGIYCVQLQVNQGSSTTSQKYSHIKEYTINSADTWEKKILTFPGLTAQTFNATSSNAEALRVNWWLAVGSSDHLSADTWAQTQGFASTSNQVNFMDSADNEWYLCGCQLEIGQNATTFEHEPIERTLSKCQRYFQFIELSTTFRVVNTSEYADFFRFHNEMRAAPTAAVVTQFQYWNVGTPTNVTPQFDTKIGGSSIVLPSLSANGNGFFGGKASFASEL